MAAASSTFDSESSFPFSRVNNSARFSDSASMRSAHRYNTRLRKRPSSAHRRSEAAREAAATAASTSSASPETASSTTSPVAGSCTERGSTGLPASSPAIRWCCMLTPNPPVLTFPVGVRRANRLHDALIPGAAAEVARDGLPDLLLARLARLHEEIEGRQHKARGTKAALQTVLVPEGLLDRMQGPRSGSQAFYGQYFGPVGLRRVDDAGAYARVVKEHGAGAAHPMLAPQVRPAETEVLAQEIGEGLAHLYLPLVLLAVDRNLDGLFTLHLRPLQSALGLSRAPDG